MVASTLRMPEELHHLLKEWAKDEGRSVNDLAVDILGREAKRHEGLRTLEQASRFRERLRARYGTMADSAPVIREMREERSARG